MAQDYKNFPVTQGCLSLRGSRGSPSFLRCETLHSRAGTSSRIPLLCSKPSLRLEGSRCQQEALPVLACIRGTVFRRGPPNSARVKWTLGQLDLATGCPCERAATLSHVDASCLKFSDLRGSSECLEHSRLLVNMCWLNKWRCIHNSVLVPMVFFKFNNLWSKARR